MESNKNVFVLTYREGTEQHKPSVFSSFDVAHDEMVTRFNAAQKDFDEGGQNYSIEDTYCERDAAVIASYEEWLEWKIFEVEVNKNH